MTQFRPIPADFAATARGKSISALMRIYSAGAETVTRWVAESGVKLASRQVEPLSARSRKAVADLLRNHSIKDSYRLAPTATGRHVSMQTVARIYEAEVAAGRLAPRNTAPLATLTTKPIFSTTDDAIKQRQACDELLRRHLATGCHWINDPAQMQVAVERLAA